MISFDGVENKMGHGFLGKRSRVGDFRTRGVVDFRTTGVGKIQSIYKEEKPFMIFWRHIWAMLKLSHTSIDGSTSNPNIMT